ncbi:MAG: hypothetical protein JO254_10775, partial [Pseudolabrys sp.]|nr:hypothetical protein [Pseudolabrys sp.]
MALLSHYRQTWFVAVSAALALPMLVQAVTPHRTVSLREARTLAPTPTWPRTPAQWVKLPRETEAFLVDHFGLREPLVRGNALLRHALTSPSKPTVMYGRAGRLFFNGDGMLEQSAGLLHREAELAQFVDFAVALAAQYRAKNIPFLVVIPPNATTIERQFVPSWYQAPPGTEYDTMMRALTDRHVPHIDLRLPLAAV